MEGAQARVRIIGYPRAHDKILRVARPIADLAGSEAILPDHPTPCWEPNGLPDVRASTFGGTGRAWGHLAEALQYRSLDRQVWASLRLCAAY